MVRPSPKTTAAAADANPLLEAARALSDELALLEFPPPIAHVYDPHRYAWAPYEQYVTRYGKAPKRVVLLGMNPGPFGLMQTGVPFGEVAAVRDWMGIRAPVERPADEHAKRIIQGFDCHRSEVSGRRLWGWAALRFGSAENFFKDWFVLNYCPLALLEESGRNFTPDKLPGAVARSVRSPPRGRASSALTAMGDRHRRFRGEAYSRGARRQSARQRACAQHSGGLRFASESGQSACQPRVGRCSGEATD